MKNKGQVLVAFILILPILILLFGMVFELGSLTLAKHEAELKVKQMVVTALEEHQTEAELNQLIRLNLKEFTPIKVEVASSVTIHGTVSIESMFTRLFHLKKHQIPIHYQATLVEDQIKVKKG